MSLPNLARRFYKTAVLSPHPFPTHPPHHKLSPRLLCTTPTTQIYSNPRRGQSLSLTFLALGQATFWATALGAASQISDPLITPIWTAAGLSLSAGFGLLVTTYLRRNVAQIALVDASTAPALRVVAHAPAGLLAAPVDIPAKDLVAGPKGSDPAERYWTFSCGRGVAGVRLFYIVDVRNGVLDREALAAAVAGGDQLMAFAHRRNASRMKRRWTEWEREGCGRERGEGKV